ncbi:MAG TPA: tetratricopeptide repeat protein [Caldimonas sp.]|jgi:hypothetical protein|nr:tetratricopeptide repeat protein [Caldimonas sp.]HEX2539662.1 tetratricopeptide repeat protein [Caldimonas sp.]
MSTSTTLADRPAAVVSSDARSVASSAATHAGSADARGCPVSTRSRLAIEHAEQALWRLMSYIGDPLADIDAAIAADPSWPLPHVIKANAMLATTEHAYARLAASCLDTAVALGARANDRERAHIAATRLLVAGRWAEACAAWERIVVDEPQDVVALLFAHAFDFFRGDSVGLQRRISRALPRWSTGAPLHSFVLGLHAFGLEENNHYAEALDAGLAALAGERRDAWAVHAVAHVHEMRGEHEAGSRWLSSRVADWAPDNGIAYHNWWHVALFHLERCEFDAALALLDQRVVPGAQTALQRLDAVAMLWRLRLLGVDVGDRWQAVADAWATQGDDAGYYAFNDVHSAIAQIGAGRLDAVEQILVALDARAADATSLGAMAREVGAPLVRGLLAHARGDAAGATETLWQVREVCQRFGGSHAQRDIVTLTLLDAAIGSGQKRLARHVLNERAIWKRATPLTEHWARRIG